MKIGAIGVVELSYFSNGVVVLDQMLKASDIDIVSWQQHLGGKMVHTVVSGTVSNVEASINAARESESLITKGALKVAVNITNPHPQVLKLMNMLEEKLSQNEN